MMTRLKVLIMLSLGTLCASAFGAATAHPGTLNYIEGSAYLAGQPLTSKSVGSAGLDAGQTLRTAQGKAEILLTPGVYLRLDENSSVRMISPDLTFTELALEQGRASVEVDEIYPQNDIQILTGGVPTQVLKRGYYDFNTSDDMARVFSGKAAVHLGENKWVVIKSHHELALNAGDSLKPRSFDTKASEGEFYNWSSLRSQYLSEANAQISQQYPYGYAPGWYWDPWLYDYTFMGPYPFYSPFGWGFYPFGWAGGFYGGGFFPFRGDHGFHGTSGFHGGGFDGGFHGAGGGGRR